MTRPWPHGAALLCAAAALVGFAGNSLLARVALGSGHVDAATFTLVRLASGAVVLAVLAWIVSPGARTRRADGALGRAFAGGLVPAAFLFAYAAAFSFAYVAMDASVGALVLFGAVQITMIGRGLATGDRPGALTWFGLFLAAGGLVLLTLPGAEAPDAAAAALMAIAGVAWGLYSLRGRATMDPLGSTAANFVGTLPLAVLLSSAAFATAQITRTGLLLAVASGAVASAIGYILWYAALPSLTATEAAIAQLVVPVLTAAAAVVLLDEAVTGRLVASGTAI
ncbi:MAG TPA: DMT family transporter, partial [Vicinamibacterales bacterium]|nr:DMT family transporter [Vicinamibacterales bacterium]